MQRREGGQQLWFFAAGCVQSVVGGQQPEGGIGTANGRRKGEVEVVRGHGVVALGDGGRLRWVAVEVRRE